MGQKIAYLVGMFQKLCDMSEQFSFDIRKSIFMGSGSGSGSGNVITKLVFGKLKYKFFNMALLTTKDHLVLYSINFPLHLSYYCPSVPCIYSHIIY